MPSRVHSNTQQVFIWLALIPVILAVLAYVEIADYRSRVRLIGHTQETLSSIYDVELTITQAETGQRGFLLTGESSYLGPFEAAEIHISSSLDILRQLVMESAVQRTHVYDLSLAVDRKMAEMRRVLDVHRMQQPAVAADIVKSNEGFRLMEQIRSLTSEMEEEEHRILQRRLEAQERSEAKIIGTFVVGVITTFVLLIWARQNIIRYADQRDRAESHVRALNEDLENRVRVRTADLATANEQLRRSNEDLSRFAYVASHDLQEPLRMVTSYVQMLSRRYKGQLDQDADEYIEYAVEGATRMQRLILDVLDYARAGGEALDVVPVDMNEICARVLETLHYAIEESGGEVKADQLPVIEADEDTCLLVLQNLIANAIKFRRPEVKPVVHIGCENKGNEWVFAVADNGIGFDMKFAERVFGMFQRLHLRGTYEGTGIGLAICKRRIENLGGRIWVESVPGVGSTFYFTIPA